MPERKKPRVLVRFTAADGSEWTVYDVTWSNKKHHRPPHGDPTATKRVFVNADGVKRAYTFKPSDSRVLEEQALERQLRASAFLPTAEDDPDVYTLSERQRRTPTFSGVPKGSATAGMTDIDGASETAIVGLLSEALKYRTRRLEVMRDSRTLEVMRALASATAAQLAREPCLGRRRCRATGALFR